MSSRVAPPKRCAYGENPNRARPLLQFQVILKPEPANLRTSLPGKPLPRSASTRPCMTIRFVRGRLGKPTVARGGLAGKSGATGWKSQASNAYFPSMCGVGRSADSTCLSRLKGTDLRLRTPRHVCVRVDMSMTLPFKSDPEFGCAAVLIGDVFPRKTSTASSPPSISIFRCRDAEALVLPMREAVDALRDVGQSRFTGYDYAPESQHTFQPD